MLKKYLSVTDNGSLIIITITLILFIAALFTKAMTHDILLEAGVFLVSVKLIISTYKITIATKNIQKTADETLELLKKHAKNNDQDK